MKTLPADLEALMPEPDGYAAMTPNGSIIVPPSRFREVNGYAIFTADQVREAMLAATERAAKPLSEWADMYDTVSRTEGKLVAGELRHLAALIRGRK